ncbi:MAG: lamin tail domain-containing protein [Flavobacteriales bacterium]
MTTVLLAQTPFTATYDLAGNGNNVTTFAYNGTVIPAAAFGSLDKVGITTSSSTGNYRGSNWPTGTVDVGSPDLGKYIEFVITVQPGFSIDMTTINFGVGRSGTGPRNWQWRSSVDTYGAPLPNYTVLNAGLANSSGALTQGDVTTTFAGNDLDLSAAAFQGLGTGVVIFRFYGYNAEATGGTGGLAGNLTISGTYEAVVGGCGLIIGTPTTSCNGNTPGLSDTYDLSIPYTGVQGDLVISTASGTIGGDDPTMTDPGTIVISGINEADAYSVTFSTPCDDQNVSGPGPDPACDPPPSLVINEILADPDGGTGDANGDGVVNTSEDEFVEIVNTAAFALNVSGWTINDLTGVRHVFPPGTVIEANCGILVFGGGLPNGIFGGMPVQTASTGTLGLNNTGDQVSVLNGATVVVAYTYSTEGGDNQSLTWDPDLSEIDPMVKHTLSTTGSAFSFSPGTFANGDPFSGCTLPACTMILGAATTACESNGLGLGDTYSVTVPYTGGQAGINVVNSSGSGIVGGDDPGSMASGDIIVTGIMDIHSFSIALDGICAAQMVSGAAPVCEPIPTIVINEVDYDNPGTDDDEWVELYNNGPDPVNIAGFILEFASGAGSSLYGSNVLPSVVIPAGGYFVVGNNASNPDVDFVVTPTSNLIQNGAPDAIGLRDAFGVMVDAVSYEGNSGAPYIEGAGFTGGDDNSSVGKVIARFPNGADTDDNNADWIEYCSTIGAANMGVSDSDGDGLVDCLDFCPTTVNSIPELDPLTCGCNPGFLPVVTQMGDNTVITSCEVIVCTTDVTFDFTMPGIGTLPTFEFREVYTNTVVQSGGGGIGNGGINQETTCLPDGKFTLFVDGVPFGGNYNLHYADAPFTRLVDNTVFAIPGASQVVEISGTPSVLGSNGPIQIPVGPNDLLFTSCDKYFWKAGEYIVCNEDADVAAVWIPFGANAVQSSTTGYDFWFYDPNGGYSYIRQRRHNVSDNFGSVGSGRTCHMKVNNWASANHIPDNAALNVRIRAVVNNLPKNWGPACRFQRNEALGNCPPTNLFDIPGHFAYSCNVFRDFNVNSANRLYARPVAGATQYRFTITNAELVTPIVRVVPTYYLTLGWGPLLGEPLLPGQSYDVTVEAFKGGVYCQAGKSCLVTINNMVAGGQQNVALNGSANEARVELFPNPNAGDLINVRIHGIEAANGKVNFDMYDLSGKCVLSRTLAAQDGILNTTVAINGELANGMYMVKVSAGEFVHAERIVIQP